MEIAQGYARRPKRIYAVEKCGFFHFVITLGYPFCTNFLQTFLMKKVRIFSYLVVLCWFLTHVSLKTDVAFQKTFQDKEMLLKDVSRQRIFFKRLIKTRNILHNIHRDMSYCYSKHFSGWKDVIGKFLKTRKCSRRILWNGRLSSEKLSRWWIYFETIVVSDGYPGRMFKQNNENHIYN